MSTTTEPTEAQGVELSTSSNFSLSFPGGSISHTIIVTGAYSKSKLEEIARAAQMVGTLYTVSVATKHLAEIAASDQPDDAAVCEFDFPASLAKRGVEVQLGTTICFDEPVSNSLKLRDVVDELDSNALAIANTVIESVSLEELRRLEMSPAEYLEIAQALSGQSLKDHVPPGLDPEHWHSLIDLSSNYCSCGRQCFGGVIMLLERVHDPIDLIDQGLSHEAAEAVFGNETVLYLRDAARGTMGGFGGIMSLDDLAGVFAGAPEDLEGPGGLGAILGGLRPRRRRRERPQG